MLKWVNMEPLGVHWDLQEDILDNYTVSASETEQSKQASKTEKKNPSCSQAIPA